MKKRFVILLDNTATAAQHAAFLELIKRHYGWWHWFPNSWLLLDQSNVSLETLREQVKACYPSVHFMAMEMAGNGKSDSWLGYGIQERFKWIYDNWTA